MKRAARCPKRANPGINVLAAGRLCALSFSYGRGVGWSIAMAIGVARDTKGGRRETKAPIRKPETRRLGLPPPPSSPFPSKFFRFFKVVDCWRRWATPIPIPV